MHGICLVTHDDSVAQSNEMKEFIFCIWGSHLSYLPLSIHSSPGPSPFLLTWKQGTRFFFFSFSISSQLWPGRELVWKWSNVWMINHRYVHNLASFLLIPELSQATLKLALFVGLLLYEIINVLFVKAKKKKKVQVLTTGACDLIWKWGLWK